MRIGKAVDVKKPSLTVHPVQAEVWLFPYERFSNCKMIFQLLYWAYQSFFGRIPQ